MYCYFTQREPFGWAPESLWGETLDRNTEEACFTPCLIFTPLPFLSSALLRSLCDFLSLCFCLSLLSHLFAVFHFLAPAHLFIHGASCLASPTLALFPPLIAYAFILLRPHAH